MKNELSKRICHICKQPLGAEGEEYCSAVHNLKDEELKKPEKRIDKSSVGYFVDKDCCEFKRGFNEAWDLWEAYHEQEMNKLQRNKTHKEKCNLCGCGLDIHGVCINCVIGDM